MGGLSAFVLPIALAAPKTLRFNDLISFANGPSGNSHLNSEPGVRRCYIVAGVGQRNLYIGLSGIFASCRWKRKKVYVSRTASRPK